MAEHPRWRGEDGQDPGAGVTTVIDTQLAGAPESDGRELERRKPRLSLRLLGSVLLRLATRVFDASLFQLPPRITRLEPLPSVAVWLITRLGVTGTQDRAP